MKTLHQLTKEELEAHLLTIKGAKKKTAKSQYLFEKKVLSIGYSFGSEYEYVNVKVKVNLVCSNNHDFYITPDSMNRGSQCSKCSRTCKEQAKDEFEKVVKLKGFSFCSSYEYKSNDSNVILICDKGHEITTTPTRFRLSGNCPKCTGRHPEESKRKFEEFVIQSGFTFDESYIYVNASTKVTLLCSEGHLKSIAPHSFMKHNKCMKCKGKCPEQFKNEFEKLALSNGFSFGDEYVYKNSNTSVILTREDGLKIKTRPLGFKERMDRKRYKEANK